jgi:hypothetical protein
MSEAAALHTNTGRFNAMPHRTVTYFQCVSLCVTRALWDDNLCAGVSLQTCLSWQPCPRDRVCKFA